MIDNFSISVDTAIETLGYFFVENSKQVVKATNPEEKEKLQSKNDILRFEMEVIYGKKGDAITRASIFDKVVNHYCPIMKNEFA